MKLTDVTGDPIELAALAADKELAREVQGRLSVLGLLDPPIDGRFGPASTWALAEFCKASSEAFDHALTPAVAAALKTAEPNQLFPLAPDGQDFASQIIAAMLRRGYWIARHPGCINIVYLEGMDPDGRANADAPNEFNDARIALRVRDGRPEIVEAWEATTEPGRYWTEHPMNPTGAARIAFGQYKAWVVGTHHPGTAGAHEALVQAEEITVYRDLNHDYEREGDRRYTGMFAINQHWGYDMPKGDLGRSSAGCLVGRSKSGHRDFMKLAKGDLRFRANLAYRFTTAIMPGSAIGETHFDPASPH